MATEPSSNSQSAADVDGGASVPGAAAEGPAVPGDSPSSSSSSSSSSAAEQSEEKSKEAGDAPPKPKRPKWLPLESNPEILNGFMQRVGVLGEWEFEDVFGLDAASLAMLPQPILAICLLFPSKPVREGRRAALEARGEAAKQTPPETFYLVQHREFGNACGTIAAVHAIGNLARSGILQLREGSPIEAFLHEAASMDGSDAGRALARAAPLHEASDEAARSRRAQTQTPGRNDRVDGHFVVFTQVGGCVVELDGCIGHPISHGDVPATGFAEAVASVIQKDFMAHAPGDPNFSVMALVPKRTDDFAAFGAGAGAGAGAGEGDIAIDETQVQEIVGMGFDADQARAALLAAGGSAERAIEILLS